MDVRVEQGIQRQTLINIARAQAPRLLVQQRLLVQVENQNLSTLNALNPTDEALFVDDKFVDMHRWQVVDQLHQMPGSAVLLTGIDLGHPVPKRAADVVITLGQQRHIVDQLVGVIVLRFNPASPRF